MIQPDRTAAGLFANPWLNPGDDSRGTGDLLRRMWERITHEQPPNPTAADLPRAAPEIAAPHALTGELRITWIGHSTFLVQLGGTNLLTDPIWSRRASPLQHLGPARFTPAGLPLDALPPLDAVLISHDHYDHLDAGSVDALHQRYGDALQWITPLGYKAWFAGRGITRVREMNWMDECEVPGTGGAVRIACTPAQHWTRRTPASTNRRLWSSFVLNAGAERRCFFAGDSGYFDGFAAIGAHYGPFDATLLPIGAYEPRWFMRLSHMNPEEAVHAYRDLGGRGVMIGMHWGTFRLTDEDPLEPPRRTRAAWRNAALPADRLCIPRHGETVVIPPLAERAAAP